MTRKTHHIHLGGPSYLRPYECHGLDGERLTRVRLGRNRTLTVYRVQAGYVVLKSGHVPYLGEESFAYFLRPWEDPKSALEPKKWRGRGLPPKEEWGRLDPRLERGLEATVFTREQVEKMMRPFLDHEEQAGRVNEGQAAHDAYWVR